MVEQDTNWSRPQWNVEMGWDRLEGSHKQIRPSEEMDMKWEESEEEKLLIEYNPLMGWL